MACDCKDSQGDPLGACIGTCRDSAGINVDSIQQRSDKSIEDRFEYMFSIFLEQLDRRIVSLQEISMDKWKDGFIKGYHEGREDY